MLALTQCTQLMAEIPALAAAAAVLWAMIAWETRSYGESRTEIRAEFARGEGH